MRFSRTNMRLAAARCRSLSRKIGVQTAEFSITAFCWRNADSRKSRTYERHNAEIRLELFNLSDGALHLARQPAAAAAVSGVGQSRWPQDAGLGAVAVRAWGHAALHTGGRQLAQHGGVDRARAQAPGARRAASAQSRGDRELV